MFSAFRPSKIIWLLIIIPCNRPVSAQALIITKRKMPELSSCGSGFSVGKEWKWTETCHWQKWSSSCDSLTKNICEFAGFFFFFSLFHYFIFQLYQSIACPITNTELLLSEALNPSCSGVNVIRTFLKKRNAVLSVNPSWKSIIISICVSVCSYYPHSKHRL